MKRKNKITFLPTTETCYAINTYPKPSKKYIANWYKKIPGFLNGDTKLKFRQQMLMPNVTIKKCIPFLDAMTSGYMVSLEEDIYVEIIDNQPLIRWRSNDELITWHTLNQFEGVPIPDTYHRMIAKWANYWTIITPKNYSILFSHPFNRLDLPFFTLSGIVSCDTYLNPVQFPFVLKKEFEGIIEAGTPICQLTLIKNESWKTKVLKYDKMQTYKNYKSFAKTFIGAYKKNFWNKHDYQ